MLGHEPFYHRTLRSMVVAFGSMFKDIELVKYHTDSREEISRLTVPLKYEGKENFVTRIGQDPDANKGVQIVLPQMSFELGDLIYDDTRKVSGLMKQRFPCNDVGSINLATPYSLGFNLYIYVRNQEDGLQIVEQILPFFNPTFTLSVKYVSTDCCDIVDEVPFTLESVLHENQYEGMSEDRRVITWTLSFNSKIQFFGPVNEGGGLIKDVTINIRDLTTGNVNATINVVPNPLTANATDDFGYTTTITENI